MSKQPDKFVQIHWTCDKCNSQGFARQHQRPDETLEEVSARHQAETRMRCVGGCVYVVDGCVPLS